MQHTASRIQANKFFGKKQHSTARTSDAYLTHRVLGLGSATSVALVMQIAQGRGGVLQACCQVCIRPLHLLNALLQHCKALILALDCCNSLTQSTVPGVNGPLLCLSSILDCEVLPQTSFAQPKCKILSPTRSD